jgi:hypothetical protein
MPYLRDMDADFPIAINTPVEAFDSDGPSDTEGLVRPNRGNEPLVIAFSGTNTEVAAVDLNFIIRIDDRDYIATINYAMDGAIRYLRINGLVADTLGESGDPFPFGIEDDLGGTHLLKCRRFQVFIEPTSAVGTAAELYIYVTWIQWWYRL